MEIYPANSDSSVFYAGLCMRDPRLVVFGARVRAIRKEKGLSQEGLSNLAGIDRSYMGQIERGEINLTLTKLFQIALALDVKADFLVSEI